MENIEDIYELSPLQQGILFHALYAPTSSVYFEQICLTLEGLLDRHLFKRAWQQVVARHPALRTAFHWEELDNPLQVVHSQVELPWQEEDWRTLSADEQQQRLEAFLAVDRQQGFDLATPPLMRFVLIQTALETYQFVWSHHHLLLDGWSVALVLQEVLSYYQVAKLGQSPRLERSRPYRDYILWLQQQDLSQAEHFWRQALAGVTAPTPLVVARPLTNSASEATYAEAQLRLSRALTQTLTTFAQAQRLTLNTLLQGVWAILLHRYSGESSIVFGVTVSGRPPRLAGVETMVGLLINTLPMRVEISDDAKLLTVLQQIQMQQAEQDNYAYTSLVAIQGWSNIPRQIPLFESLVVFENYPIAAPAQPEVQPLRLTSAQSFERTNYPLTLVGFPGEELCLRIIYDTRRFEAETISRLLGHLQTLLENVVIDAEAAIADLDLLTQAERHQLLVEWNDTQTDYPQDKCIHQLFEEQVEKTPDAVAVVFEEQQLTYQQLNSRANQLAHYLQSLGVGSDMMVGICVERSWEMVVGLLGILKAGGAYVPLDPAYPKERLAYMLSDTQVSVLLTQERLVPSLCEHQASLVCLDRDWEKIALQGQENLTPGVRADNLAYVMYTSGSTGQPKGVCVLHQGVVRLVKETNYAHFNAEQVFLQLAPIAFDASTLEIWGSLLNGAKLALFPGNQPSLEELGRTIKQYQITTLWLTSGLFNLMVDQRLEDLKPLEQLLAGGDVLSVPHVQKVLSNLENCQLINGYGPTENTTFTCCYPISQADSGMNAIPIGRPISNTQVYILDSYLQPVPIGVKGELYIGGDGLAKGYLNRPDLTQEKFIANPFGLGKLYKTGDLTRYLPDGNIEFLGRIDNQVKIRGFRIELGEIEAALSQHPQVRESVVIVREDQPDNKLLVAYLVTHAASLSQNDWRQFLAQKLPDYMIPSRFVCLELMPLTPNGKIDRKALPDPDLLQRSSEEDVVPPRTPTEEILVGIWTEVLGVQEVSINDNFFELGGHSLLGTKIVSRIRDVFGIELGLKDLFETSSLKDLSRKIEIKQADSQGDRICLLHPFSRPEHLPLSIDQQRLWFLNKLTEGSLSNNNLMALSLEGKLDVDALKHSLQEIYQRHESLRTYFPIEEGQPIQKIAPDITVTLPTINLQGLTQEEQEREIERISNEEVQYIFDLSRFPLVREKLLTLNPESHVLLLTVHHIIFDHISSETLIKELSVIYSAFSHNELSPLSELSFQFADFTLWQWQNLENNEIDQHLKYWQQKLANINPLLELPFDGSRPTIPSFRGRILSFSINAEITQNLQRLSQRSQVTLFMTLMAGFSVLLHRLSDRDDIIIGTPFLNRNRTEFESIIGFFATPLPLRIEFSEDLTFETLLHQIRQCFLEAYTHQEVPLLKIAELVPSQHSISYNPLFQVLFTFLGSQRESIKLPELVITPQSTATQMPTELDLSLTLYEKEDYLEGILSYQEDLFEEKTIQLFANFYCQILAQSVDLLTESISHFSLPQELEKKVQQARLKQHKLTLDIAIASTFTSEPIENSLNYWTEKLDWQTTIKFAAYNQIFQELLNPNSVINQNQEGINLLLIRLEDWVRFAQNKNDLLQFETTIRQSVNDLITAIQKSNQSLKIPLILTICPPSPTLKNNLAQANFLSRMEALLVGKLRNVNGVNLITSKDFVETYPTPNYYDATGDELGHIPYTELFYAVLGTAIARKIYAIKSHLYKVIVMDCDNTLWQGVCGEDGATGVIIDEPRKILQEFIVEQQKMGKLLCLCSKNQEEDVWAVFAAHPTMPLQQEHLVAWQINWQSKSANLQSLANELNLGLDSFILIDDNPVECAEVRANCPEVLTLQLPENSQNIPQFLNHIWAFDLVQTTAEDRKRTELYQQNREREKLKQESLTFSDFLAGLNLNISIEPVTPDNLSRVSQLTQRTNQFNLTTIRRSEGEIQQLLDTGELEGRVVAVKDRFGDYGLVGVVLFRCDEIALTIDTFLLSCRVLGRGVEYEMLRYLGNLAQQRNLGQVNAHYYATAKNQPILDFLESIGKDNQQKSEQGWLFQFPPELIININFNIRESVTTSPSELSEKVLSETTRVDLKAPWQLLTKIATELVNPIDILKEIIEANQQQHRSHQQVGEFVVPRNEIEQQLAFIWQEVLKIDRVGIYDNFFEVGGNSILSIQIIARANQAGLGLTLKQVFQHQTIAELAEVTEKTPTVQAEQGIVTGLVPLTPIQQWFFEQKLPEPGHFNQSVLLEVSPDLKPELLEQALEQLMVHHDALRLRFVPDTEDRWQQVNVAPDETILFQFQRVNLSDISLEEPESAIEATAERVQMSLNLSEGPLVEVVLFNLGMDRTSRLLIVIHHLAIDGISWRILLEDITKVYQQLNEQEIVQLSAKTTAFRDWAVRLTDYAQSDTLLAELDYWLSLLRTDVATLPRDYPSDREANTVASAVNLSVSLDEEQTRALLQDVPAAYSTQINDVLITALVQSFSQWTGKSSVLIDLEGHGREELFEDVDLSRTLGWFTTIFPVLLQIEKSESLGEALKSIKEQLRQIPQRGIGYGLLRYLRQEEAIRGQLAALPQAELSYNYLEQFDKSLLSPPLLGFVAEGRGEENSTRGKRSHLLDVNAAIIVDRLKVTWTFSEEVHERTTVERLAQSFIQSLQALIVHCQSPEAVGYTPSDFPEAELSQEELDLLLEGIN